MSDPIPPNLQRLTIICPSWVGDLKEIIKNRGGLKSYLIIYAVAFQKAHGEYPTPDALRKEAKRAGFTVDANYSKTLKSNLFLQKFKAKRGRKRG